MFIECTVLKIARFLVILLSATHTHRHTYKGKYRARPLQLIVPNRKIARMFYVQGNQERVSSQLHSDYLKQIALG